MRNFCIAPGVWERAFCYSSGNGTLPCGNSCWIDATSDCTGSAWLPRRAPGDMQRTGLVRFPFAHSTLSSVEHGSSASLKMNFRCLLRIPDSFLLQLPAWLCLLRALPSVFAPQDSSVPHRASCGQTYRQVTCSPLCHQEHLKACEGKHGSWEGLSCQHRSRYVLWPVTAPLLQKQAFGN